ncbi:MAG: hypothetical protein GY947_16355 [Rhodobacteraceae bacterium]|nr:hypothetical protein [Paracoccaceae bacterium]
MCYVLVQIVGTSGQVIGMDMNAVIIPLARRNTRTFAQNVGCSDLRFQLGSIDDLTSDLEVVEQVVTGRQIASLDDFFSLQDSLKDKRNTAPMVRYP